jgi:hypothetical protein
MRHQLCLKGLSPSNMSGPKTYTHPLPAGLGGHTLQWMKHINDTVPGNEYYTSFTVRFNTFTKLYMV